MAKIAGLAVALLAGGLLLGPPAAEARRLVTVPPRVVATAPAPCGPLAFVPSAAVPYGYPYGYPFAPYPYGYVYPYAYPYGAPGRFLPGDFAPGYLPGANWRDRWEDVGRVKVHGYTLR